MAAQEINFKEKYFSQFALALNNMEVTDGSSVAINYAEAVRQLVTLLTNIQKTSKKVIMVGNGGSAGICSHMTVDYWKNGNIRSVAFNDSSLLTCLSNDISFEQVFSKSIGMFADEGDVVFCISSSGKSANIINAAEAGTDAKCTVVTFSGFETTNPLRKMGAINFYVPSFSYGFVEVLHNYIIHHILKR
jgi:D-sedoheptulose 7-phosphate isomerase